MSERRAIVVGGGLAGSEAAWALANRGVKVTLHEMRPAMGTPAHQTGRLAELVCSNSFKSVELGNAHGLLKAELRLLGSLLLECADAARVPGGAALVVDREVFSAGVDARIRAHPNISVSTAEATELPAPGIVATGPLTSERLAAVIAARLGTESLAFYDAIAPIVSDESLDHAPLSREEYEAFIGALGSADQFHAHEFDAVPYFEGCLPVEEMARRGPETLRFGPMKPVGLRGPDGRRPWAVVQLRQENLAQSQFNLVGFQSRMRWPDQQRVFRMIPGLERAEFVRLGQIHRNTFVNSPLHLDAWYRLKPEPRLRLAGQITGVEGYLESAATGLAVALYLVLERAGEVPPLPPTTALGSLARHLTESDPSHFQPANVNYGLFPELEAPVKKNERRAAYAERARRDLAEWAAQRGLDFDDAPFASAPLAVAPAAS